MKKFKLEKLELTAYKTGGGKIGRFKVPFNPATLRRSFEIDWSRRRGVGSVGGEEIYQRNIPEKLHLDLLLDGTGVTGHHGPGVDHQVQQLEKLTIRPVGDSHEPALLKVKWGALSFTGRLSTCEMRYTLFDRDGKALRAEVSLDLISDDASKRRGHANSLSSPDMTHRRVVRAGDTLPLLTDEIYGAPDHFLDIARWNGLDNFRSLEPGRELFFPPLTQLTGEEQTGETQTGEEQISSEGLPS